MELSSQKGKLKKLFNHTYGQAQIELFCQYHIQPTSESIWALKQVYLNKLLSISLFSQKIKKKNDLDLSFFMKHHLEEIGDDFIKKLNTIFIGKTHVEGNAIYYF